MIHVWDCTGQVHWSLNFIRQVFGFDGKGCQGCTYRISLDFVAKGCQGYLQEKWTLHLVKQGSTGEVQDDGSHGREGEEVWYRR